MINSLAKDTLRDVVRLFCGEELGRGIGRAVFVLESDPTRVLKIEDTAGSFQNVVEWQTWDQLRDTRYAAYLAPCHMISPCGFALIQSRVQPLPSMVEAKIGGTAVLKDVQFPDFLTDHKPENYGLLKGRVVCCDYGSNLAINHGAFASKMRTPKWW